MSHFRPFLIAVAFAAVAFSSPARADSISLGSSFSGNFSMIVDGSRVTEGGGNIGGSTGVIGGNNVMFSQLYCVDQFTGASLSATYNATYNTSGTINSQVLAVGGQIAWLMNNIAPTLTTQPQYQALQGLIWQLESPTSSGHIVQFDTNASYNSAAAIGYFNSFASSLGTNTAPVSSVYWINPENTQGQYAYQGFVGVTTSGPPPTPVPEPASLALFGIGILGLVAARRRRL